MLSEILRLFHFLDSKVFIASFRFDIFFLSINIPPFSSTSSLLHHSAYQITGTHKSKASAVHIQNDSLVKFINHLAFFIIFKLSSCGNHHKNITVSHANDFNGISSGHDHIINKFVFVSLQTLIINQTSRTKFTTLPTHTK
jgi:hypothetical protein